MTEKPKCFGHYPIDHATKLARECHNCDWKNVCHKTTTIMVEKIQGTKHDQTKPRWSLLPRGTVPMVIAVLEYGAVKYQIDNWQHVSDPERRYYDAAMRHIQEWLYGEDKDPESGLPHLAHAVACLLFIMWFDREKEKKKTDA